jgi:hypothetical protein
MSNLAYVVASEDRSWKLMHQGRAAGVFEDEDQALAPLSGSRRSLRRGPRTRSWWSRTRTARSVEAWRQQHAVGD